MPDQTPEFAGICGTSGRPCKLVWASTFPTKVGTYPSNLLPSRRTIWHASAGGGYNFNPAGTAMGGTGTGGSISGMGLIDAFAGFGIFGSDVQTDTFRPKTQVTIIFAKTENRINISKVLTQSEINSKDENGNIEIDVGECIFEPVSVTLNKDTIATLWAAIQAESDTNETPKDDYGQDESVEDRQFRKLVEASRSIPEADQLLEELVINKLGIEYRLDNGGPKSNTIFNLPGMGDLNTPNYRDGTSQKIKISIVAIKNTDGTPQTFLAPGTVLYLTYIAIKEHYLRQVLNVSWNFVAQSLPPQCYPIGTVIKAANYRFYEWSVKNSDTQGLPIIVRGWRCVETFNCPVNINALVMPYENPNLGLFIYGPASGTTQVAYLPAQSTNTQILGYIDNKSTLPTFNINLNDSINGASYDTIVNDTYKKTSWYIQKQYSTMSNYEGVIRHSFYNVHKLALKKRDVDKVAIERSLAEKVLEDVTPGKETFFPFYDSETYDDISQPAQSSLNNSNTLFAPVQPVSSGFFAEMQCGTAGGQVLFPAGGPNPTGDVIAFFQMESPIITEKFDKGTRVLVERHFTTGQVNPTTVAIEGAAGTTFQAVSCAGDPSYHYAFTCHSHERWININYFQNSYLEEGIKVVQYDPSNPPKLTSDNMNPTSSEYARYIGFSGMLGDKYGYKPGKIMSLSSVAPMDSFILKSSGESSAVENTYGINHDDVKPLSFSIQNNTLSIDLGDSGFYGITEIKYKYKGETAYAILRMKNGDNLLGTVDEIDLTPGDNTLKIDHQWMQANMIELTDIPSGFVVNKVTVLQLKDFACEDAIQNTITPDTQNLVERLSNSGLLFESEIMSIGMDANNRLFVFFNDQNKGISALSSHNFGTTWYMYYGIVEPINELPVQNPFLIHESERDNAWLFYQFMGGKILCKQIDYTLFNINDANLIEKTSDIVQQSQLAGGKTVELSSKYTDNGAMLRREMISNISAGDLTDSEFLTLTGRNLSNQTFDPFEERIKNNETVKVYKYPLGIGSSTAFTNKDIEDVHFSVYRTMPGNMNLFFLAPTKPNGDLMLQCNHSNNNGINWYYLWELVEYGYDRIRYDETRQINFIDISASGPVDENQSRTGTATGDQQAKFGINIHWSRLAKHKIEGVSTESSELESQVLPVSAPYAFYYDGTDTVFLFYIYEGCLLCKIFSEKIFYQAPMSNVKNLIEREIKAYFVDGDLSNIKDEINYLDIPGNIVFIPINSINTFNNNRRIPTQRVCAYVLRNGNVRVFYKNEDKELKSSLWNGNLWLQEDLFKDI